MTQTIQLPTGLRWPIPPATLLKKARGNPHDEIESILPMLPKLYATDGTPPAAKIAYLKFFAAGRATWYVVEGEIRCRNCDASEADHDTRRCAKWDGDWLFFGYVVSPQTPDFDELGYFRLSDLPASKAGIGGGGVERDLWWKPAPIPNLAPAGVPVKRYSMRDPKGQEISMWSGDDASALTRVHELCFENGWEHWQVALFEGEGFKGREIPTWMAA